MAKQDDGINGGYRGKVGPVVGYMWRGQWCTRTMPRFYHDAKTEAQLEQRELFKAEVAFAGRVKEVLHVGFYKPALAAHKTECNYFLMDNKGCFAWDGEGMAVDYSCLRVSEGPVAPVGFGEPTCTLLGQYADTLLSQPRAADSSPNLGEQPDSNSMVFNSSTKLGEVDARRADGGVCAGQSKAFSSQQNPHPDPFGATQPPHKALPGVPQALLFCREGMATQNKEHTDSVVGDIPSLQGGVRGGGKTTTGCMTTTGGMEEGLSITIPFEKNPEHRRCEADDRVYVAAFCESEAMLSLPVYRRTRSITIELPAEWTGHEVHLYGFVQDNASRTSDSVYLGAIILQYTPEHEEITLDTPDLPEETKDGIADGRTVGHGNESMEADGQSVSRERKSGGVP